MKVYLCSRVAKDAHFYNNVVAHSLRALGHDVFVPHLQEYNEVSGASETEIFRQDFCAMQNADACVVVGRIGVDCAFEAGWFKGVDKPIYWVMSEMQEKSSPMLSAVRRLESIEELKGVLSERA